MKRNQIYLSSITAFLLTASLLLTLTPSAQAETKKIFCGAEKTATPVRGTALKPLTIVETERGTFPVITWVNELSSAGWTPIRHCYFVSKTLQDHASQGKLNYIRTGQFQNNSVLCVVSAEGESCNQQNLLLTVQPNQNPASFLTKLLDVNKVNETTEIPNLITTIDGQTYLNFNLFLENIPLSEEDQKEYYPILASSLDSM
jgi:hypothetical protein